MKKNGVNGWLLAPSLGGWVAWRGVGGGGWERAGEGPDPGSVLRCVPGGAELVVALPENVVVTERMELPGGERGEIAGMVELQLEKSLPYPMEDSVFSFDVVRERGADGGEGAGGAAGVVVFCVVAGNAPLEDLLAALRVDGRVPARMVLHGQLVASGLRGGAREVGRALCVWGEPGGLCAAVVHSGRLEFLQGGLERSGVEEFRRFLLAADLAGAGGGLEGVHLEGALWDLEAALREATGLKVERMGDGGWDLAGVSGDLVPAKWRVEQERSRKSVDLKARVQMGAALYLMGVAAAFLYLAWLKYGVRRIDAQLLQIQPVVEEVNLRRAQWDALAPAVDPSTYTVELLYLVSRSLPSPEVKITVFEQKGGGFKVEGEAPSPIQWTEFMEKLRAEPGLAGYRIEGPPPGVLSNGGARFNIFGKP